MTEWLRWQGGIPFATFQDGVPPGSSPEGTTKTGGRRHRVTRIIKKARFVGKTFFTDFLLGYPKTPLFLLGYPKTPKGIQGVGFPDDDSESLDLATRTHAGPRRRVKWSRDSVT